MEGTVGQTRRDPLSGLAARPPAGLPRHETARSSSPARLIELLI